MRLQTTPPITTNFTTLLAASTALIAANYIDATDAANLAIEAAKGQQAGGDPAELFRILTEEKLEEKYAASDAKYGHHIFQGDFSGTTPTGYHSKIDGSATHEAYGTVTATGNKGAYQQSVRGIAAPHNRKVNRSTFFPDAATHRQVIKAITSVYELGFSSVNHVAPIVNGMLLTKRGDTVYPAGGRDDLTAE